ncbi:hypothetical protein KY284_010648 [Solanum tuberosum]|nr:hypothetical protein KY284_010648 [Solanum tuberosum]
MVEIESSNTQITETSDRVSAINAVDSSHAFYIHPSDYLGMNLVSTVFDGVRSNILLSSPLPTISQAYSLVIQDEKQREIHATPAYPRESTSFLVGNAGEWRFNDYKTQQGNSIKKTSLVCNYCKKTGHTIDQCYKIHDCPSDFKFTKSKKYQKGTIASNVFSTGEGTYQGVENDSDVNSLSQENVAQLLQLLQKLNQKNDGSTNPSANLTCAGPFTEEASGAW